MVGINMWMDLFKKVTLERGYEYFESGKIKDIHWDGNTVYGKVNGTEEYNVSAEIDGENVGKLSCDCPYAKGQKKCKHMAALLFKVLGGDIYIDDEYDDEYYDEDDDEYYEDYLYECDQHYNNIIDDDYRIDELIDSLDEKRLKDVLKYLLENDNIAKRSFLQYINSEDNNINIEDLKESIDCIFYENSDDEYIGYDEASILWDELNDFVDIEIVPLIGLHRYMEAVELTLHLASSFTEYDIDDSDGIIMGIYSRCEEIISSAICLCSEKEEEKIFQAVVYEVENNFDENGYYKGFLDRLLFNQFKSEKSLKEILKIVNSRIKSLSEDKEDSFSQFYFKIILSAKLKIMEELNFNGDIQVPMIYEDARNFSEGFALVKKDGRWGYINENGKPITEFKFLDGKPFKNGEASVRENSERYYIDTNGEKKVFKSFCGNIKDVVVNFFYDTKGKAGTIWSDNIKEKKKIDL